MSEIKNNKFYSAIIVSDDLYPESRKKLESFGIEVCFSFCNANVSTPLQKHTDMQIVQIGDKYVCAPESYEYYKSITGKYNLELIRGNTELSSNYPADVAYNITVTERVTVHNFKYTDAIIKENLSVQNFVNVSQGYSKCSLCVVNDSCFISSDAGIITALNNNGCNVLEITPGFVKLPGFDYGFLGGASFKLGDNILGFNGNIEMHPDYDKIMKFCKSSGVEVISLSEQSLMDIGSAVIIK